MANIEEVISELKIKIADLITENIILKIDLDQALKNQDFIKSELEDCRIEVDRIRQSED